ncbi:M60 family metallopeptidase [Verrucomicrobiales bacterium BCK34]|nr:M60 family metallopeptidase [Verrucomicrobiales bacterium BCK34]
MTKLRFLILASLVFAAPSHGDEKTRKLITQSGGEAILGKSVPGLIDITTDDGFPLIQDARGNIIAAAGESEKGRAIGFTHGSFLKPGEILAQESVMEMLANSIRWAGRSGKPTVGLHPSIADLEKALSEKGIGVKVLKPLDVSSGMVNAYCVIGHESLNENEIQELTDFATKGGGLVVATTPWAFNKKFEDFSDFPGNRILAHAGIQFMPDGYARNQDPVSIGDATAPVESLTSKPGEMKSGDATESAALAAAKRLAVEKKVDQSSAGAQLLADLFSAKALKGAKLVEFLEALKALNLAVGPIIPTKENPVVPAKDPLLEAIIELETYFNETAPAGVMYAIPAASDFPGAVPEDAGRITKELTIDGTWRGWLEGRNAAGWAAKEMRPTGVYAAPGEVIKVTAPARIAGEGFEVTIGSYGGKLNNRDAWHRYTGWQVSKPVASKVTEVSSGLGGLVTIRVPRGAEYESLDLVIEGGVRAPLYEHGKTDLTKWASEIRKYPAPWAEIAGPRMIIALPSEYIRTLSDPDEVMEIWSNYIDTAAELVQVNRDDYRAERIVFDRQTSAGSMHSSYPVAAHLGSAAEQAVDANSLKKDGNWGFFHEYGHNHQHNLWALPGTGETTCNLWSVYIFEEYVGKDRDDTHRAIRPLDRKQRVNGYFSDGAKFENWSVWVALETYLQVQEEFGWEPFKKVFDEYNRLEPGDRPEGQAQINDQWVIRLSKACGKNLQPFWATWGLPMSSDVERALKDLPVWEDHPVAKYAGDGA